MRAARGCSTAAMPTPLRALARAPAGIETTAAPATLPPATALRSAASAVEYCVRRLSILMNTISTTADTSTSIPKNALMRLAKSSRAKSARFEPVRRNPRHKLPVRQHKSHEAQGPGRRSLVSSPETSRGWVAPMIESVRESWANVSTVLCRSRRDWRIDSRLRLSRKRRSSGVRHRRNLPAVSLRHLRRSDGLADGLRACVPTDPDLRLDRLVDQSVRVRSRHGRSDSRRAWRFVCLVSRRISGWRRRSPMPSGWKATPWGTFGRWCSTTITPRTIPGYSCISRSRCRSSSCG